MWLLIEHINLDDTIKIITYEYSGRPSVEELEHKFLLRDVSCKELLDVGFVGDRFIYYKLVEVEDFLEEHQDIYKLFSISFACNVILLIVVLYLLFILSK